MDVSLDLTLCRGGGGGLAFSIVVRAVVVSRVHHREMLCRGEGTPASACACPCVALSEVWVRKILLGDGPLVCRMTPPPRSQGSIRLAVHRRRRGGG